MSDSDLGKLNRYMGGTDDAAQFVTVVDDMGEVTHIPVPTVAQPSDIYRRAVEALQEINALREGFDLTFDQAVQIYLIGKHNITIDPISFPPVTERRKGE